MTVRGLPDQPTVILRWLWINAFSLITGGIGDILVAKHSVDLFVFWSYLSELLK